MRYTHVRSALAFASALIGTATSRVSAQTPAEDPSARLRQVLPADVAARVRARIADARARDLPAAALENRALKSPRRASRPPTSRSPSPSRASACWMRRPRSRRGARGVRRTMRSSRHRGDPEGRQWRCRCGARAECAVGTFARRAVVRGGQPDGSWAAVRCRAFALAILYRLRFELGTARAACLQECRKSRPSGLGCSCMPEASASLIVQVVVELCFSEILRTLSRA